jgi:hypothetical protein
VRECDAAIDLDHFLQLLWWSHVYLCAAKHVRL